MFALPLGKTIELDNCYYILVLIKNIISIPLLLEQSYEINFKGNGCFKFHLRDSFRKVINGLIVLEVNDEMFHIEQAKKRKGII